MGRTIIVDGRHDGGGAETFRTVSEAAERANPGDTVLIRAGVYRERVAPPRGGEPGRPITYAAYPGESPVLRGSEVVPLAGERARGFGGNADVRRVPLAPDLFADPLVGNPFGVPLRRMPGYTLGQAFLDGALLREVVDDNALGAVPGSYKVEAGGAALLVNVPRSDVPDARRLFEVTTRSRVFAPRLRGLGHVHLRGLTIEHCANQFPSGFWVDSPERGAPQAGAIGTRSGHHWRIERCVVRHAKGIGIDCGSEGGYDLEGTGLPAPEAVGWHLIRDCEVSDNGACGIAGWKHAGTRIVGNLLERNNCLGFTAPETGGIKVHGFLDGLIEANVCRDNDCVGIWLDNVYYGSRVTRNVCVGGVGAGIFVEMGDGPVLVDHNVCALTRTGDGIYCHDASGGTFAHNLLYANAHFGVYMRTVTEREVLRSDGERVPVATERNRVVGNVFIDNHRGHLCLPVPDDGARGNGSDYNLFLGGTLWHWEGLGPHPFVLNTRNDRTPPGRRRALVSEALERAGADSAGQFPYLTFEEWRAVTGWDAHSVAPPPKTAEVKNGAVEKGSVAFSARDLYVEFRDPSVLAAPEVPAVGGADEDLYARPLPAARRPPGPFGVVSAVPGEVGATSRRCWLHPVAAPDPAGE